MQKNELQSRFVQGLKFFIVGAARSGLSAANLLKKYGASVVLAESDKDLHEAALQYDFILISPGVPLYKEIVLLAKKNKIPVVSEIEVASWFLDKEACCIGITGTNGKSTTANYTHQLFERAKRETHLCGNIGYPFSQVVDRAGKTAKNVSCTADRMALSEARGAPCTNNAKRYTSDTATKLKAIQAAVYVLELSSYQLETTYSLRPMCTALLNIQNDHLERYGNIDEYLKAKWRLLLLTQDQGLALVDKDVLTRAVQLGLPLPRCRVVVLTTNQHMEEHNSGRTNSVNRKSSAEPNGILEKISFGKTLPIPLYRDLKNLTLWDLISEFKIELVSCRYEQETNSVDVLFIGMNDRMTWKIQNACLLGEHNALNILCASLVAQHLGVSDEVILSQWERETSSYRHLPHRLENIGGKNQIFVDANQTPKRVTIVNDSKATNVESTLVALKAFCAPVRLLLGGQPKGDSYLPIADFVAHGVVKVYPFGKAGNLIAQELKACGGSVSQPFAHLLDAARCALMESQTGEVILLSPGCSSFDEFKDFEDRGDTFRNWAISCFEEHKN